ncbi:MAG: glycosyltransferase [Actinomycetia bacterium]|nr:glycosyltransferase [Actinomycetes bacterium]MCP4963240.1 glycosyltransferase [Actinomycetes bacterium]
MSSHPKRCEPVSTVAICIATFRRPIGLERLLGSVAELSVPEGVDVSVIVCDNDPDRSAFEHLTAEPPALPFTFQVVHQPDRGVASVRNSLVGAAVESGADGIAFIDDDEEVPVAWLANLVEIQHETGVAIVSGPVASVFEVDPPDWLSQLGYFDPIDRSEAELATFANSNNVLMHTSVLGGDCSPFDTRLNLTGGEDTHFFRRCIVAGHKIRWTEQSMPLEYVPESKMTLAWMRQREYRRGTTRSFVLRDVDDSWARRGKRLVGAVAEFGRAASDGVKSILVRDPTRRRSLRARAGNQAAYGAGMIAGLFGANYSEYDVTHGK